MNLNQLLTEYRQLLLETAFADLAAKQADQPNNALSSVILMRSKRDEIVKAAREVTAERFVAEAMAAGFIK